MSTSKVTCLPWSELRPRRETPPYVVDAIPDEHLHRFVRLLATRPFHNFSDAQVAKDKLRKIRQMRTELADVTTETRRAGTTRVFALGRRRRDGSSVVQHEDISSGSGSLSGDGSDSDSGEGSINGGTARPPRKQRRGNRNGRRVKLITTSVATVVANGKQNNENGPKIGNEYQAYVDPKPTYDPKNSRVASYPTKSVLMFCMTQPSENFTKAQNSKAKNKGKDKVESTNSDKYSLPPEKVAEFEKKQNAEATRCTGFPLSPFALEVAWTQLYSHSGNQKAAQEDLWRELKKHVPNLTYKIEPGTSMTAPFSFYPGIEGQVTHDEYCSFVRSLTEHGKDFHEMSYDTLRGDQPFRTRSELVWIYYARHKQWRLQGSRAAEASLIVDNGSTDQLRSCTLTPFRAVHMLHALAVSGNDGFPPDHRLTSVIKLVRDRTVSAERRRRDAESGRRPPRNRG